MDVPARRTDTDPIDFDGPSSIVTCHETSPGNVVFTERENADGWIATDIAVDVRR